jgi:hypothetical protein
MRSPPLRYTTDRNKQQKSPANYFTGTAIDNEQHSHKIPTVPEHLLKWEE